MAGILRMDLSLPLQLVAQLNLRPVIVITDTGLPVSVGRLHVTLDAKPPRVDLEFETNRIKCRMRVSQDKWSVLLENWDGEFTRYILAHGDGFWLDEADRIKKRITQAFMRAQTNAAVDG